MRILDSLNTQAYSTFLPSLLPATTEPGPVDRTELVATELEFLSGGAPYGSVASTNLLKKEDNVGWLDGLGVRRYYRAGKQRLRLPRQYHGES